MEKKYKGFESWCENQPGYPQRFVYDGWTLDTPRLAPRDGLQGSPGASPLAANQGWNVVMMLDGLNSNATTRKYTLDTTLPAVREGSRRDLGALLLAASQGYTWGLALDTTQPASRAGLLGNPQASPVAASQGLDLSGTIHGAGGIGGLLAAVETQGTTGETDDKKYWYFYDGNGNVRHILNGTNTGNLLHVAYYEYDAYGNLNSFVNAATDSSGEEVVTEPGYAETNRFRFSTKWQDSEIAPGLFDPLANGLYCYGYRYYSPRLGRWISRDPIGEEGGLNLHVAFNNAASDWVDPWGEQVAPGPQSITLLDEVLLGTRCEIHFEAMNMHSHIARNTAREAYYVWRDGKFVLEAGASHNNTIRAWIGNQLARSKIKGAIQKGRHLRGGFVTVPFIAWTVIIEGSIYIVAGSIELAELSEDNFDAALRNLNRNATIFAAGQRGKKFANQLLATMSFQCTCNGVVEKQVTAPSQCVENFRNGVANNFSYAAHDAFDAALQPNGTSSFSLERGLNNQITRLYGCVESAECKRGRR